MSEDVGVRDYQMLCTAPFHYLSLITYQLLSNPYIIFIYNYPLGVKMHPS